MEAKLVSRVFEMSWFRFQKKKKKKKNLRGKKTLGDNVSALLNSSIAFTWNAHGSHYAGSVNYD